jgi:hypothetical protein
MHRVPIYRVGVNRHANQPRHELLTWSGDGMVRHGKAQGSAPALGRGDTADAQVFDELTAVSEGVGG